MSQSDTSTVEISDLLSALDGSGSNSESSAVAKLRAIAGRRFPAIMLGHFRFARKFGARAACVFYSLPFAKTNEDAVTLAAEAIVDKSKIVRRRGAQLLAYSLRRDKIPDLQMAMARLTGTATEDLLAAIDAIASQNHNYFVDRTHSGQVTMEIRELGNK